MSEHTKEPWYLARNGAGSIVCAKAATLLPLSIGARCLDVVARTDWGRGREDEANAKRIVACVSACEGIETKYLEHASLDFGKGGMVKRYFAAYSEMELDAEGDLVDYSDYLRLRSALRDALIGWEAVSTVYNAPREPDARITELRKQFLGPTK